MAKKKTNKVNKGNETKKRIWLIINFALIMVFGVLIAVWSEVVGIAYLAKEAMVNDETFNLTVEIIKNSNHVMNRAIALSVGIYAAIQLLNYIVYLFKKKKVLFILALLEIVASAVGYFVNGSFDVLIMPVISALIYLRVLRLEES